MSSLDSIIGLVPASVAFWLLFVFNSLSTSFTSAAEYVKKIQALYLELSRPEYYIFFKNSPYPYRLSNTHTWATGSAVPEFVYWANSKIFMPWVSNDVYRVEQWENGNTLPLLSLDLVNTSDDTVAYDLTDFIEGVRYVGDTIPTLNQVIAVWTLASNVVPNLAEMKIRYVNEDGETIIIVNDVCLLEETADGVPVEDALDRELSDDMPVCEVETVSADLNDCIDVSNCCVQA